MNKPNITITINRGQGNNETLTRNIVAETTSHYRVQLKGENFAMPEWFAKQSRVVNCKLVSTEEKE